MDKQVISLSDVHSRFVGSGKTYTMEGPEDSIEDEKSRGMITRAVEQIFYTSRQLKEQGWTYEMHASFLEVYNDNLRDLLLSPKGQKESKLDIKQDQKKGTNEVIGLSSGMQRQKPSYSFTSVKVVSPEHVFDLLKRASGNRRVASTDMNDRSSRSHSIFQLKLDGKNSITKETVKGALNLIDLAGSEKLSQSGAQGVEKQEAIFINKSLTTLGNVISAIGTYSCYRLLIFSKR